MSNLFLLEFNWYGFLITAGIISCAVLAYISAKKRGHDPEVVLDMVLYGVPLAVIGARLYYIIFEARKMSFLDWFKIWEGGLAIYGGVIGAIGAGFLLAYVIFKNRKPQSKLSLMQLFDLAFACFLLGQAIGRWGNYANQEVYGAVVDPNSLFAVFPFAVKVGSNYYHALFFYESVWNAIGFGILFFLYHYKKRSFDGFIFALYCIWYGLGRAVLEGLRDPRYILWLIKDVLPVSVFVSIIMILLGAFIIFWHIYNARHCGKKVMILVPQKMLNRDYYDYKKTVFFQRRVWAREKKLQEQEEQVALTSTEKLKTDEEITEIAQKEVEEQQDIESSQEQEKKIKKPKVTSEFDDEL